MTWNSGDVSAARQRDLAPILKQRGYALTQLADGAWLLREKFPGLIVRGNLFFWKTGKLTGNPIDFLMYLEGRTFDQAMHILKPDEDEDEDEQEETNPGSEAEPDEQSGDDLPGWVRDKIAQRK